MRCENPQKNIWNQPPLVVIKPWGGTDSNKNIIVYINN